METTTARATRRELGAWGEELACRYLTDRGWQILDRNWRGGRAGEVDIVARDGSVVVFCEVKTRSGVGFGDPVEAVSWPKYARLRRLAGLWLEGQAEFVPDVRIDVLGILRRPGARPLIRHVIGVGS